MNQKRYTINDYLNIRNAFGPSLSASGRQIAYASNLDGNTLQIYAGAIKDHDGVKVTDYEDGISLGVFSPSEEDILLFAKDIGGNENTQLYLKDLVSGQVSPITNKPKVRHNFGGWSRDGRFLLYSSTERNGTDFDIYLYEFETKKRSVVFDKGGWCTGNGFSPSGRFAVVSQAISNVDNDLYLIDLANQSEPVHMTPHKETASYFPPRWLSDESGFFLISSEGIDTESLYFYDLKTRKLELILNSEWDIESIALTRQDDMLVLTMNEDGYNKTHFYQVSGTTLTETTAPHLPSGELSGFTWSLDGARLAFNRDAYNSSYNVWVWDRESNTSTQLTSMPMSVKSETMVEPELIHYLSFDGLRIPAFLYLPKERNGACPAIVNIHGGPEEQYKAHLAPLTQYYVSQGYAVIAPNVRGSSGYGKKYLALDDKRKRLDSVKDLQWLHKWAEQDKRINANKMALMGGSYGGYMVLAGLAFQPKLWAGGVDIVGIANFVTFLQNTSAYRRKLRESEYGSLASDRDFLEKVSPINKADDISAPLFIIHGANDPRVPLNEAQQIHASLEKRGIPTQLIVYEDEGHGLAKLKNRLDAYPKVAQFLASILEK